MNILLILDMQKLNFPNYSFRFKNSENKIAVFDEVRKKFIILTPEEWVRLHTVQFLRQEKNFPMSYINVEKQLMLGKMMKRYDVVVFNNTGEIHLIVECKAPSVKICQDTFDQIARYNMNLKATYLMVTNGLDHYYCQMDYENEKYNFLQDLPSYSG
ncbi:MAG TPA: type I restriction enzyme HsdR N-terminal domain-containing protein [Gillisia sp.]|nr:type I restriction enzyme HsdR N-terminal domain-containing protein [Gillisia sp.]